MTVQEELRLLKFETANSQITLQSAVEKCIALLNQLDKNLFHDQIRWLEQERDGYPNEQFPPSYIPPHKTMEGKWELTGLANEYRIQTYHTEQTQVRQWNPMPVAEIDHWVGKLQGNQTATVSLSPLRTSNRSDFNEVKQKILSSIGNLIEKVLEHQLREP